MAIGLSSRVKRQGFGLYLKAPYLIIEREINVFGQALRRSKITCATK